MSAVISTAAGPSDIAVGPKQSGWQTTSAASLTRIDPATNRVVRMSGSTTHRRGWRSRRLGARRCSRASVLRIVAERSRVLGRRGLQSIDPAISYESYNVAIPSLTSDGLVAFKHAGGSNGSTLVPDLATSLPSPTDAGKAYTFKLRPGIRYSTGRVVQRARLSPFDRAAVQAPVWRARILQRDRRRREMRQSAENL